MNATRTATLGLLALTLLLGAAGQAQAAYRFVPWMYPTIQAAEDASLPGDTIYIMPGEYRENVVVDVDNVTIMGGYGIPPTTIIDGGSGTDVLTINSLNVTVRYITLRHGEIGLNADPGTDLHLYLVHVQNSGDDGIYIADGDRFRIENCLVTGPGDDGIYVEEGDFGLVSRTTVRQTDSYCFYLDDVDDGTFTYNAAWNCEDEDAFYIYGDRCKIQYNSATHSDGEGFYVDGDDNVISRNTANNINHAMFYIDGDNNLLEYNSGENTYYDCIYVTGDYNTINYNTVSQCFDETCAEVDGDYNVLTNNNCMHADEGFDLDGDYLRVENNTVHAVGFEMFDVYGDGPTVRNNRGTHAFDEGFYIDCDADCRFGEVSGNIVDGCADDCYGFEFDIEDPAGMLITRNSASNTADYGFYVDCDACTLTDNSATSCGDEDEAGFYLMGGGNDLQRNRAQGNDGAGFKIEGDRNMLSYNTATSNTMEGFLVSSGTGNLLERNSAYRNWAEGFDNGPACLATDFLFNSSMGNRTDCTNDGTINQNVGNTCQDGSNFAVPSEIW